MRITGRAVIVENDAFLLIKYVDDVGPHYNFPGGGVEGLESIEQTVAREAMEEACVEVEIGRLLTVYEYSPNECASLFGPTPGLSLFFECSLRAGNRPAMPEKPDPNQVDVEWVPFDRVADIMLIPNLGAQMVRYFCDDEPLAHFIRERDLPQYKAF